jgi:hypothetical protein
MKCFEVWVVVFFEHGSNMRLVYRELSCEADLILWGSNIERPSKNMQIQQNRERGKEGACEPSWQGGSVLYRVKENPENPKPIRSLWRDGRSCLSLCWALREASDQVVG